MSNEKYSKATGETIDNLKEMIVKIQDIASQKRVEIRDELGELKKKVKENEETLVLNTCREIFKPYCPIRVADLDQIKENKEVLLNHLKEHKRTFGDVEKVQRGLRFFRVLVNGIRKLDSKKEKSPESLCTLREQRECGNEGSMDCLKGNSDGIRNFSNICIHGKRELEKEVELTRSSELLEKLDAKGIEMETVLQTKPEKELYELYLKDGGQYYFKKIIHPFTEYNNMVHLAIGKIVVNRSDKQELIEGVQDKLEFLRDKVLEAPILSGSVQDLRDHIHDLKDLVVKSIEEYEGMLN